ncbi:unnamed protein product [Brassica oleracea var. botrytis]|uniref:(rape) hypothetical protein n=1 Tax=Brassica napus TaxID=3708 RepID=A0A078HHT3_BRANA|nr:unnamed protein product [Brassica napus]CDY37422.1 BnaC08g45600D [Brassica napus]
MYLSITFLEFGEQELAVAFQPYGKVVNAKVFVDKATGGFRSIWVKGMSVNDKWTLDSLKAQ